MRVPILAAALAACAAPAFIAPALAAEANDYLMKAPEGDHPGREYVVHGVRVVEGQPRWAVQNRQVVDERFLVPDIATTTNVIVRGLRGEGLRQPGYRRVFP
jgi:hypothetical protein